MTQMTGSLKTLVVTLLLCAAVFSGCDFQNISMTDYYKDHTATASVVSFSMKSSTLNGPDSGLILILPGEDATLEVILDNKRKLDLGLAVTSRSGRIDNVSFSKQGPEKVLITIRAPALKDEYALTLEIQDPDGVRTLESYPFPKIKCISADVVLDLTVPGTLSFNQVVYSPDSDIDYDLWVVPATSLSIKPAITIAEDAVLTLNGEPYNHRSPSPVNFSAGPVTFRVTAQNGDFYDYVVSVRHVMVQLGTQQYCPDITVAVAAASGTEDNPATITLLDNITFKKPLTLANGTYIKLTVPQNLNKTITIEAAQPASDLFIVNSGASLTFEGNGSGVLAVGGANSGSPVDVGNKALIAVNGGKLVLNGKAELKNVKSEGADGGAVYLAGGTFTMNGGELSGNTATQNGGAVYVAGGTFTMNGGELSGNTATQNGGAVYSNGTFNMGSLTPGSATINGNQAQNGGGVYLAGGNFAMAFLLPDTSGTISGNTATQNGGGVYVDNGSFTMAGSVVVNANNPVYLAAGKTLNIGGPLAGTTPVATIRPAVTAAGTQVLTGSTSTADNYQKFALHSSVTPGFFIGSDGKLYNPDTGAGALELITSGGGTAGSPAIIIIPEDAVVNAPIVIPSGSVVKLVPPAGENVVIERGTGNGGLFTVGSGAELRFGNSSDGTGSLTIDGNGTPGSSLVTVSGGGKLVLDGDDVTIKGGNAGNGGAVNVSGGGSEFTMSAGKITGSKAGSDGGAVYIGSGAAFNMSGGIIGGTGESEANSATTGGGVLLNGGTFTMSGNAKIAYNKATSRAGGVQVNAGTFTMKDNAVIEYNKRIDPDPPDPPDPAGYAFGHNGGGVGVIGATAVFNLEGNAEIRYNTANGGGGVLLYEGGKFYMSGGKIHDNEAKETGGGVWMDDKFGGHISSMEMTGGTIYNNATTSPNSGYGGGGIYVGLEAELKITSKTNIQSNTTANPLHTTPNVQVSGGSFKVNEITESSY